MRLLTSEHKAIHAIMKKHGLTDQYLLVKRRGWVIVQVGEKTFSFHRKDLALIEKGNFKKSRQYFVKVEKKKDQVNDFSEVKKALESWMISIKN